MAAIPKKVLRIVTENTVVQTTDAKCTHSYFLGHTYFNAIVGPMIIRLIALSNFFYCL